MRFNPLLDRFPTEYRGVQMNTDFRVGILLSTLFESGKVTDDEKKIQALVLLYGEDFANLGVEPMILWDGLVWFMNLGYNRSINKVNKQGTRELEDDIVEDTLKDQLIFNTDTSEDNNTFDFEFDSSRIYSGFLRTYGIDLSEVEMHFFKFMFLLADLESDCSYSRVLEIRQTDLKDMDKKRKSAYIKMKKLYAIPVEIDEESKAKLKDIGLDDSDLEFFMQY